MGLELSLEKCEGPTRILSWTGTTFNSITTVMSIDKAKVDETMDLVAEVLNVPDVSLKVIECLLGKLQHVIKFCPGGRRFLNRLLEMR